MINFKNIKNESVDDGVGRIVNWTRLKGKTIYLTGHGLYFLRDGYCGVPAGTTIHFYQHWGRTFPGSPSTTGEFIRGKLSWIPDRSFREGQSCPNLTLVADDAHCIEYTNAAIVDRMKAATTIKDRFDHFNFNCNHFSGLQQVTEIRLQMLPGRQPPKPSGFKGRPMLKLDQILQVLGGNTLHWLCCQSIVGVSPVGTSRPSTASPEFAPLQPFNCFSETVQAALKAAESLSAKIQSGSKCREGNFGDKYTEGTYIPGALPNSSTATAKYTGPNGNQATQNYLSGTHDRVSQALASARPGGIQVPRDRDAVEQWRLAIQAGITAIQTEPQGDPEKVQLALQVLQPSLFRADTFLRELNALGSRLKARA